MPKISILMGIYNCGETLPEAIDSILKQTYQNWELILCDDGSADDTYAVAESYREQYPEKIILIRNDRNMGLNHTLNHCLQCATGEYVARMDGDDISLPERFEKELSCLEAHPEYAIVSCPMIYFDETGDWQVGRTRREEPTPEMLVHGTIHCHAPCMIRTEAIREVGGYSVDRKLLRVEDWHLWMKLYAAGYRGRNLTEPLYKMRDDQAAAGRRKLRYRFNEAYVSLLAIKTFKQPAWKCVYALRPVMVGLLPMPLYHHLHRKKLGK